MSQISLQVPEVHCDHCKTSIEGAGSKVPGVEKVDVTIADATVTIDHDDTASIASIKQAIEEQGYAVFG
jgi:copper chaperone